MDYLFSLVGKDQETITEAIKELAENSEKVKALGKENGDLHSELEESKVKFIISKTNLIKSLTCLMSWSKNLIKRRKS